MVFVLLAALLAGCGGSDNTIQNCIVANESYTTQSNLQAAAQPESLAKSNPVYVSVHIIESPKGTEYTVKWYLDDTEIKSETKATQKDTQDIIVYALDAENVAVGTLKVDIAYKNTVLFSRALPVE